MIDKEWGMLLVEHSFSKLKVFVRQIFLSITSVFMMSLIVEWNGIKN
jgi:hypothetical protein